MDWPYRFGSLSDRYQRARPCSRAWQYSMYHYLLLETAGECALDNRSGDFLLWGNGVVEDCSGVECRPPLGRGDEHNAIFFEAGDGTQ